MAQAFNFETRELTPYTDNWNRGGNVKISGALWYIPKLDGLYIVDNPNTHPGSTHINEYCVSRGLPAALLAQGDALVNPEFNFMACYQAYFKIARELFPTKPTHDVRTVLEDWVYTLNQSAPIDRKISGYIDNLSMMSVACFFRNISNPYRTENLIDRMNHDYYYICRFKGSPEPKLILSQMPAVADRTEAPLIYASAMHVSMKTMALQADGFIAAVFNLALYYYWQRRWTEFNFTNTETIDKILKAYNRQYPIIDMAMLHRLPLSLPDEVGDLCKAYMDAFFPVMQKVWKMSPTVQLECIQGQDIYTYIYAHEVSSKDTLIRSELYANLMPIQQQILLGYNKRFLEWLVKNYPITSASQHRVMRAMAKDMPPIELHLQTNVTIIRDGQQTDIKENEFTKLITANDKQAVLTELHHRVDGRKGKDIGIVIAAAAYKYHVLSRTPTEVEFREEFPNIQKCTWKSISEWLKKVGRPEDLRPDIKEVELNF